MVASIKYSETIEEEVHGAHTQYSLRVHQFASDLIDPERLNPQTIGERSDLVASQLMWGRGSKVRWW